MNLSPVMSFDQCKTFLGVNAENPRSGNVVLRVDEEDGFEELVFEIDGLQLAGVTHCDTGEKFFGYVLDPYTTVKNVEVLVHWMRRFSTPDLSDRVSRWLDSGEQGRKMFFRGWYVRVELDDIIWNFNQYGAWGWSTYGWFLAFAGDFIRPIFNEDQCRVNFETLLDYFLSRGYVLVSE
jgi:hypothetical protein